MSRTGLIAFLGDTPAGLRGALLAVVLAAAAFVLSNLALLGLAVALPADFFCRKRTPIAVGGRRALAALLLRIGKNAIGVVLLALGVLLILPGVPGPGLALIVVGLAMVDFPGKRRLQARLLTGPRVLGAINRLRARWGRPPLIAPRRRARRDPTTSV